MPSAYQDIAALIGVTEAQSCVSAARKGPVVVAEVAVRILKRVAMTARCTQERRPATQERQWQ